MFVPPLKEPHYLLGGEWSRRGLSWYESLYAPAGNTLHRGEASTGYSMFPVFTGVPDRAAALVPEARIIYMIRHPVRRMVSHWAQANNSGHEHRPLEEAIVRDSAYYFASCYGLQLSRWVASFPREAILVLRSEDLGTAPGATIDRILSHLGLPCGWRPGHAVMRENATEWKLRTRPPLRVISGALRGAGFEKAAVHVARPRPLIRRVKLVEAFRPSKLELSPERADALLESFRSDFALLRSLAGDDIDLYGLA